MDFSSPSHSHMPRSIFPGIPNSKRASTVSSTRADVRESNPRPLNTRRHTTTIIPVRRETRPLRSSPLAGPSLAITREGAIVESLQANPPLSIPEPPPSLEENTVESPLSEAASPTSPIDSHVIFTSEEHPQSEPQEGPTTSTVSSRIRRLSIALRRRSSSYSTHSDVSSAATPRPRKDSTSSSRSLFTDSSSPVPVVPVVPAWARAMGSSSVAKPTPPSEGRKPRHVRRPSTAPSTSAENTRTQPSTSSSNFPATSRNPEENWLTSASAPRFSRLGLKGEGVVMPMSLKEARRRSTVSLSSRASTDGLSIKGKQSTRSLRSVHDPNSETARRMAENPEMQPPQPLFRSESNASSVSSVSSLSEANSLTTATPSLSRLSSSTYSELPPVPDPYATGSKSSSTLELRINDVTIDMINYEQMDESGPPSQPQPVPVTPESIPVNDEPAGSTENATKVVRRRTLKKVWQRVVRTVTG